MRLKLTALALTLLCPLSAFAQDPAPPAPPVEAPAEPTPPPPPPPPAPPAPVAAPLAAPPAPPPPPAAPAPAGPTFKWEGLADTYYLYKFTGNSVNEAPGGRVFDTLGNTFNLGYAKLAMQADTDMFGFRIDFGYGNVGVVNNGLSLLGSKGSGSSAADGAATSLYGSAFFVQQAFATLKLGIATLDAGKFNTTAGAEVIESNKNWLYSRSFLFNAIPALHTGLRLTVKPTDILSLQLSLVNGGTSNNDPDNNGFKTIGLSVGLTPAPTTSIALTSYIGKDGAQNAEGDVTVLVDLVASQSFGDAFGLNLNFDYFKASGDSAYWYGVSLMGRYVIAPSFYLAARGEFVQAKGSYFASEKTSLEEGTLMAGIPFGPNYEIRLEGRGDFTNKDGIFFKGTTSKKNQVTGLAAFLAYF